MNQVTVLIDEEADATAWYLNGTYVGHDDQVTAKDVMEWLGGAVVLTEMPQGGWPGRLEALND